MELMTRSVIDQARGITTITAFLYRTTFATVHSHTTPHGESSSVPLLWLPPTTVRVAKSRKEQQKICVTVFLICESTTIGLGRDMAEYFDILRLYK